MKECRRCDKIKPSNEFYARKSNSDGLYSYCKQCCRQDFRDRFQKNRETYLKKQLIYRTKRRHELNEKSKDYYKKNRNSVLKKANEYRKKNKKKISIREAISRISDKNRFEKNREKHLRWSKKNRDKLNEYQRQWYQKNKEKRRAHVILSRAIISGKIMRPKNCSECKKICKPDGHHLDYDRPLDVMWICRACHSRKSPRTVIL